MAKANFLPSADYLRSRFRFDQETGVLYWRAIPEAGTHWAKSWNLRFDGKQAGAINKGHVMVNLEGEGIGAHRIIWKMVTGRDPIGILDHKNRDGTDNRFSNLREASRSENTYNVGLRCDNQTGARGISLHESGRYRVQINADKRTYHIGYFPSFDEAVIARDAAAKRLHGSFAFTHQNKQNESA